MQKGPRDRHHKKMLMIAPRCDEDAMAVWMTFWPIGETPKSKENAEIVCI
jgi:hypothetical protein